MPHSLDLNSTQREIYTELYIFDFTFVLFILVLILYLHYCSVIRPKVFYCSKCTSQHPRPVGKRCQVAGESLVSDVEIIAPPSPSVFGLSLVSDQILLQLQQLGNKMDKMDRRVQRTEAVLDQGNSWQVCVISAKNSPAKNVVQMPVPDNVTASVVPSLGYLRENESLQSEVDKRLVELEKFNETATRGRLKSHRGALGDFSNGSSKFHSYW